MRLKKQRFLVTILKCASSSYQSTICCYYQRTLQVFNCRLGDWVANHVRFTSNSSNGNTTAVDTLVEEVGVCRDFAHLMIALCRAVNIPARFTTGIDYGADPALGPTDFHAYVEVYLSDGWYLFDPSGTAIPMGFVRFGTGRDAADSAFSTMFGGVRGASPILHIEAIANAQGVRVVPEHVPYALSTDRELRR